METKAIFLDVDGTLVSFDTHRVPQSAIEALQQVHESGIKILSSTYKCNFLGADNKQ